MDLGAHGKDIEFPGPSLGCLHQAWLDQDTPATTVYKSSMKAFPLLPELSLENPSQKEGRYKPWLVQSKIFVYNVILQIFPTSLVSASMKAFLHFPELHTLIRRPLLSFSGVAMTVC